MTFDSAAPLTRIAKETIKANTALMDYFLLGGGRSLAKLQQKYDKTTLHKPPTIHLRVLQGWSSRYHWQARIARQNEIDNAIALEKYRERHMSEAEALALLADQARGNMADFSEVRSQADLATNLSAALVKTITQHYTQTTRGEGPNKESEIKARIALGLYDAQKALELILKHHGSFDNAGDSDDKPFIIKVLRGVSMEDV